MPLSLGLSRLSDPQLRLLYQRLIRMEARIVQMEAQVEEQNDTIKRLRIFLDHQLRDDYELNRSTAATYRLIRAITARLLNLTPENFDENFEYTPFPPEIIAKYDAYLQSQSGKFPQNNDEGG